MNTPLAILPIISDIGKWVTNPWAQQYSYNGILMNKKYNVHEYVYFGEKREGGGLTNL